MRRLVLFFVMCFQALASASGLDTESSIRACLENATKTASSENLEAYIQCFEPRLQSSIRRSAGLRFAAFDVEVDLEEFHILSADERTCDAAVKYSTHLSGRSFEIVAVLKLTSCDGSWKIRDETLQSIHESTIQDSPFPYGWSSSAPRSSCSSGVCSLSGR